MVKKTKKEQALVLFGKNYNKPKNELVKMFMDDLGIKSEGSARTHLSWCVKELSKDSKFGLTYKTRKIDSGNLKRNQAIEIFNNNPTLDRNQMIEKFESSLDMTHNSAATHCSMCSKVFVDANPKTPHSAIIVN